ncbi:MAG: hypothetical protein ABEJ28_04510 [Salinigranum sp.]
MTLRRQDAPAAELTAELADAATALADAEAAVAELAESPDDGRGGADGEPSESTPVDDSAPDRAALSAGVSRAEAVSSAYRRAVDLLDRYRERASGSGGETFQAYLEFQDRFFALVEGLDDDLLERSAFEAASDRVDKRRLSERDFEGARSALDPAGEVAERLDSLSETRERYRSARDAVERRLAAVDERIDDLERLERLSEIDLDAPVSRLREPFAAYDESVRGAFADFRREASARELFSFVESTAAFPLVEYRRPPEALREFVFSDPAGEVPIPTLLEYADYSASKLDHYVDNPAELKTRVAVDRTYLERLGPEPLTLSWPPEPAAHLRHRVRELVSVVGRFAPEETVAALRDVRDLALEDDYDRLREAAVARDRLDDAERERLASGAVAADLADAREERERLADALEEYPPL